VSLQDFARVFLSTLITRSS